MQLFKIKHRHWFIRVLFASYLAVLVYLLFFAGSYGRVLTRPYRINLMPLREIKRFLKNEEMLGRRVVFLNVYGNVLLFIPFGALLPVLYQRFSNVSRTIGIGAVFSATVEIIQLLTRRGSCDIDDVILNTLGVAAGYAIYALIRVIV